MHCFIRISALDHSQVENDSLIIQFMSYRAWYTNTDYHEGCECDVATLNN